MSAYHRLASSGPSRRVALKGSRKLVLGVLFVGALAALGSAAARAWAAHRFNGELAAARKEMEGGLFNLAWKRLTRLSAERPDDGEVAYHLGQCEASRGRIEPALAAWARVRPDSPWAAPAAVAFAQVAVRLGRVTEAERILRDAPRRAGPERPAARHLLLTLLGQQGRVDEARRLIEDQWREASGGTAADLADR